MTPLFQMPFFTSQTWMASTYKSHYPNPNSIDLGRYSNGTNISLDEVVVASADGTIAEKGPVLSPEGDYYGDYIYVDHSGGWQTRYLHIQAASSWEKGMTIARGQRLGTVGKYLAMEPHLHYTQLKDGVAVRVRFDGAQIDVHQGTQKPDGSYPTQSLSSHNAPTGCAVTGSNSVRCTRGAAVRAVAKCVTFLGNGQKKYVVKNGPWVAAKERSAVACSPAISVAWESS